MLGKGFSQERSCVLILEQPIIVLQNVTERTFANIAEKQHHTSICDHKETLTCETGEKKTLMTTNGSKEGILLIISIKVDGITCRTVIQFISSYASGKLINLLKKKPCETKMKRVDMLITSQVTKLEMQDARIESLDEGFSMEVILTKVLKGELLTVDDPKYQELILLMTTVTSNQDRRQRHKGMTASSHSSWKWSVVLVLKLKQDRALAEMEIQSQKKQNWGSF